MGNTTFKRQINWHHYEEHGWNKWLGCARKTDYILRVHLHLILRMMYAVQISISINNKIPFNNFPQKFYCRANDMRNSNSELILFGGKVDSSLEYSVVSDTSSIVKMSTNESTLLPINIHYGNRCINSASYFGHISFTKLSINFSNLILISCKCASFSISKYIYLLYEIYVSINLWRWFWMKKCNNTRDGSILIHSQCIFSIFNYVFFFSFYIFIILLVSILCW